MGGSSPISFFFIFLRRGAGDVLNASGYHRLFPTAKRLTIITFRGCRRHFGSEESKKVARHHRMGPLTTRTWTCRSRLCWHEREREREIVQRAGWCAVCSLLFSPPTPSCSVLSSYITFFDSAPFSRDERGEVSPFPEQTPRRNLCQRFFFFGRASFVFKEVYCAYINIFHFFVSLVVSLGPLETERHTTPSCTSSSYSTFISLTSTSAWTGVIKWNDWLFLAFFFGPTFL